MSPHDQEGGQRENEVKGYMKQLMTGRITTVHVVVYFRLCTYFFCRCGSYGVLLLLLLFSVVVVAGFLYR